VTKKLKKNPKEVQKSASKGAFLGFAAAIATDLVHQDMKTAMKADKKIGHGAAHRKNNGHHGNNRFHDVLLAVMVGVLVVGHVDFLNR
jgi:hypothetical protein